MSRLYLVLSLYIARVAAVLSYLDEICAVSEDDGMMPLVNAVLSGASRRITSELSVRIR